MRISVFGAAIASVVLFVVAGGAARAGEGAGVALPTGEKTITLIANDGSRKDIGRVAFTPDGDASKIDVELDSPDFTDEFLSMRPFRCLAGVKRMWCHLAYPYGTRGLITASDLVDLEYALLFLWRPYDQPSVDAWNGLYFKLAVQPDGSIAGDLHEADFNVLAVPPGEPNARPVGALTPATPGTQVWDRIEIR